MPAIIEAWRAGLFRREELVRNLIAGIVVGVVALPLAMAFAIASGARPEQGLYTALVAGLIVTLIGGSRVQIAGPTGAFTVLLFGVTAKYGLGGLQVVTLIAGGILLVFADANLPPASSTAFRVSVSMSAWRGIRFNSSVTLSNSCSTKCMSRSGGV